MRALAIAFADCVKNTDECFRDSVLNRAGGRGQALGRERDHWLAMAGAMAIAGMRSSGVAGLAGVTPASTAPVRQLRRVNLIERQRDQRESEAVSCARAPQRPVPASSSLRPFATHPAAATPNREPSPPNGQRRGAVSGVAPRPRTLTSSPRQALERLFCFDTTGSHTLHAPSVLIRPGPWRST